MQGLTTRKNKLEVEFINACGELGIAQDTQDLTTELESRVAEVAELEQKWEAEKATLLAQVQAIKDECSTL